MLDALATIDVPQKVWVRRGMFGGHQHSGRHRALRSHRSPRRRRAACGVEVEHGVEELRSPNAAGRPRGDVAADTARRRLGVPQDARVVYVNWAQDINDIDSDVRRVVDALAHEDVHVVLGESMLGDGLRWTLTALPGA